MLMKLADDGTHAVGSFHIVLDLSDSANADPTNGSESGGGGPPGGEWKSLPVAAVRILQAGVGIHRPGGNGNPPPGGGGNPPGGGPQSVTD